MKLSHKDALSILGVEVAMIVKLRADCNWDGIQFEIQQYYRKACSKYHPDRNPAGLETMKLVNAAYEALQCPIVSNMWDKSIDGDDEVNTDNLGDEMNTALNAVIGLGLTIEICGSWIWVSGDTKLHKEILKASGYHWAPKKIMWHWRPVDYKSYSRGKYTMDDIRTAHGTTTVKPKLHKQLAA